MSGAFFRRYPHLIGGLLGATLLLAGQAGVGWWANRTAAKNAVVAPLFGSVGKDSAQILADELAAWRKLAEPIATKLKDGQVCVYLSE